MPLAKCQVPRSGAEDVRTESGSANCGGRDWPRRTENRPAGVCRISTYPRWSARSWFTARPRRAYRRARSAELLERIAPADQPGIVLAVQRTDPGGEQRSQPLPIRLAPSVSYPATNSSDEQSAAPSFLRRSPSSRTATIPSIKCPPPCAQPLRIVYRLDRASDVVADPR